MKITDEMLREAAHGACEQWLASYPDPAPDHTFSAGFEQKINRLIHHPHRRKGLRSLLIAAIIAALMTATVGAEVLQPAKTFRIGVVQVLSQVLPKSTDQMATTTEEDVGPTRRPVLEWLPEGMVEVKREEGELATLLKYEDPKEKHVVVDVLRIMKNGAATFSTDTEDAQVEEIEVHGRPATLITENDRVRLILFIDNYRCFIGSTCPVEEVVKVAENMILE